MICRRHFRIAVAAVKRHSTYTTRASFNSYPLWDRKGLIRFCSSSSSQSSSFVANIFRGTVNTEEVFPYPVEELQQGREELSPLIDTAENIFKRAPDALEADENGKTDDDFLNILKESGFFAISAPENYSGLAQCKVSQVARLGEIVSAYDLGLSVTLGAHQSIGYKGIVLFGSHEQKSKYLPDLCHGKLIGAFCLTEPSTGSDAGAIRTRAELSPDGSHYILNGTKAFISNGGIADVFTVFAQVPVKNEETGATVDKVTTFIVERKFEGVTSGRPEKKLGIRSSNTTEVYFDDVKVPKENLLGGEGEGFKQAMNILNTGRSGTAACMVSVIRLCIEKAVAHASSRVQFGRTIDSFGMIQDKIARMTIMHYVVESMCYMVAANMDKECPEYQLEAAILKIVGSDYAWKTVDEALQTLGGAGYMTSSGIEKMLRDVRVFRIFEGTNEILKLFVALTGIQGAGSHLKEIIKAFQNPTVNLGLIFEEGTKRARRMVGLRKEHSFPSEVHPDLVHVANMMCRDVEEFGAAVEDLLRHHGKGIVEEQFLLNHIAEAVIEIYCMAVVISRASNSLTSGSHAAEHESAICQVFCEESSKRVRSHLGCLNNEKLQKDIFQRLSTISKEVVGNGGIVYARPVGI